VSAECEPSIRIDAESGDESVSGPGRRRAGIGLQHQLVANHRYLKVLVVGAAVDGDAIAARCRYRTD